MATSEYQWQSCDENEPMDTDNYEYTWVECEGEWESCDDNEELDYDNYKYTWVDQEEEQDNQCNAVVKRNNTKQQCSLKTKGKDTYKL